MLADFINQTTTTWTMALFQEYPLSPGLDTVSWKQATAPTGGTVGVAWDVTYNVALGDLQQENGIGVYKASQILPAELGTRWLITFQDGVQQMIRQGDAPEPDQIFFTNESGLLASPGIGMDNSASAYQRSLLSGANAQFIVTPTYYMGLFQNVVLGEVIDMNVTVGPFALAFTGGADKVTITAEEINQSIVVTIDYSTTLARINERIQAPRRLKAA